MQLMIHVKCYGSATKINRDKAYSKKVGLLYWSLANKKSRPCCISLPRKKQRPCIALTQRSGPLLLLTIWETPSIVRRPHIRHL